MMKPRWIGILVLMFGVAVVALGQTSWVASTNGQIPPNLFIGGYDETNNKVLHVCRPTFHLWAGNIAEGYTGCAVAMGGSSSQFVNWEGLAELSVHWVPASNGAVPSNAYQANAGPEYICRASAPTGTVTGLGLRPGRLRTGSSVCEIPGGAYVHSLQNYEILRSPWVAASAGAVPQGATPTGQQGNLTIYSCRATVNGVRYLGKVFSGAPGCNIGLDSGVASPTTYEVLTGFTGQFLAHNSITPAEIGGWPGTWTSTSKSAICRATPPGGSGLHPGRVVSNPTRCRFEYGGASWALTNFEFLTATENPPPPIACTFTVSPLSITVSAAAATPSVTVTTLPGCAWQVESYPSWIHPSETQLANSYPMYLSIDANTGPARNATIRIAGQNVSVSQAAGNQTCTSQFSIANWNFPTSGGSLVVSVTPNNSQCPTNLTSNAAWLTVSPPAGTGTRSFTANATPNAGAARTAQIQTTGATLTVTQDAFVACSYTFTPASSNVPAAAGTISVQVTANQPQCVSTIESDANWVSVNSRTGTGTRQVSVSYTANTSPNPRAAGLYLPGGSYTLNQAGAEGNPPPPTTGLRFVSLSPCRVMETRPEYNFQGRTGAFGPPFLRTGETRTLVMAQSNVCQIPATAKAYVLNVTLVPRGLLDFVTLWPGGEARPDTWTARSPDGQIVANSAIVKAGNGAIQVYASNDADIILDISGYYTDDTNVPNLTYYPLTPCRVIDTRSEYRSPPGPFGPPSMNVRETRRFRFPTTPYCSVPSGAAAYSITITAVPQGALQYLTAWPAGASQPNISNINSPAGRVLANSVILPASADGSIDVFTFDRTDFLIDINGYFAPDNGQGLYYFPVTQCRVSDTRNSAGAYGGPIFGDETTRTVAIPGSSCSGIPATAKGYVINATALPNGSPMPFLTLWPTGQARPNASVLNAFQGQIATNSAIIPAGTNGSIDVFAYRRTHVVLEVSGYFGR